METFQSAVRKSIHQRPNISSVSDAEHACARVTVGRDINLAHRLRKSGRGFGHAVFSVLHPVIRTERGSDGPRCAQFGDALFAVLKLL